MVDDVGVAGGVRVGSALSDLDVAADDVAHGPDGGGCAVELLVEGDAGVACGEGGAGGGCGGDVDGFAGVVGAVGFVEDPVVVGAAGRITSSVVVCVGVESSQCNHRVLECV